MKFSSEGYLYEIDDDLLACLKSHTNRGTKAEVIRDALAVYKFIVDRALRGQRFYVGSDRGNSAECDFSPLRKLYEEKSVVRAKPAEHSHSK